MRRFGPYSDLVEIGRGGMSVVYRATAPDGRLVVLKLMAPHLVGNATAQRRFEQEGRLKLNHPNIARVYRIGLHDGTPYIEMEYIAGETLSALVARCGPLSPPTAARILADIASALDYAHCRGVIHRDIKPSNIIIRPEGRAVLTDFGVAKLPDATAYTATTARVGSVLFMSPEQAAGAYELTPAADVYALGATIYYALTGRPPFWGSSDVAIARQHIEQMPPHPSDIQPALPRAVGDVLMRALAKSPAQRPPSAGALARDYRLALKAAQWQAAGGTPSAGTSPAGQALVTTRTVGQTRSSAPLLALFAGAAGIATLVSLAALAMLLPASSLSSGLISPTPLTTGEIAGQAVSPVAISPQPMTPTATPTATFKPLAAGAGMTTDQPANRPAPMRTPRARPARPTRLPRPTRQLPEAISPIVSLATPPPASQSATPTPSATFTPTVEPITTPPTMVELTRTPEPPAGTPEAPTPILEPSATPTSEESFTVASQAT
jgi:serine/threonine-protein kinase